MQVYAIVKIFDVVGVVGDVEVVVGRELVEVGDALFDGVGMEDDEMFEGCELEDGVEGAAGEAV